MNVTTEEPEPMQALLYDPGLPYDPGAQLVFRLQRGDASAFQEMVGTYYKHVANYATRRIGDHTEAEDIAQAVFLQVFKCMAQFRSQAKFSTWLFAIARNLCVNELRRRTRHRAQSLDNHDDECGESEGTWPELMVASTAHEELLHSELVCKVKDALSELPERQRRVLLLLEEGRGPYEDIAVRLGLTVPVTKSLIYRARQKVKRKLGRYLERRSAQIRRNSKRNQRKSRLAEPTSRIQPGKP